MTQSNQQTSTTVIRRTSVDDRVPRCDAAAICFEPCLALSNVDADCAVSADANRDPFPGVRQVVMQQAAAGQCHRARLAAGGYRPVERGRPPGTVQR
jgi:hypothetical protein